MDINNKNEITVLAEVSKLDSVLQFMDSILESIPCPPKTQMQLDVAVEEIFVNIASYSYPNTDGDVTMSCFIEEEPLQVILVFTDTGIPYNPLEKEDPDINLSAEERAVGGLGIYMVKKTMSEVSYQYLDGKNILTLKKIL